MPVSKRKVLSAILFLSFISGICGLGYEQLLSRILTNSVGDLFQVHSTILIGFFGGLSLAAWLSYSFRRFLWLIEILIGCYSFAIAWIWRFHPDTLLTISIPQLSYTTSSVIIALLLIFPIAFLIGLCVPLFSEWSQGPSSDGMSSSFNKVYLLYNFGAGICVLALEYILLRQWGISASLFFLSGFNLINGIVIYFLQKRVPIEIPRQEKESSPYPLGLILSLFGLSAISGLSQLSMLKFIQIIWGPYGESFSIALALGMFGICLGTWLTHKGFLNWKRLFWWGPMAIIISFILITPGVHAWAWINGYMDGGAIFSISRVVFPLLFFIVPYTVFGASMPAALQFSSSKRHSMPLLLAITSLGNCLGYLITTAYIYQFFNYQWLLVLICGAFILFSFYNFFLFNLERKKVILRGTLFACGLTAFIFVFNEKIFHLSYRAYQSYGQLTYFKKGVSNFNSFRHRTSEINRVEMHEGPDFLVVDGYWAVTGLSKDSNLNKEEAFLGVPPAHYTKESAEALYLGVGTGISVGASSLLFDQITAIEINPLFLELLPKFSEQNFNLPKRENVEFIVDDGFNYLFRTDKKYDAIINNVPHPQHFAGSKLWSEKAYREVNRHLKPGGVYSQWMIDSFGWEGTKIVAKTLFKVFRYCNFFILSHGYYQFTCSQSPLELNETVEWPKDLLKHLPENTKSPVAFMNELTFPLPQKNVTSLKGPINTLDYPVFDFAAPRHLKFLKNWKSWHLLERLGFTLSSYQNPPEPLTREHIDKRCSLIQNWNYWPPRYSICDILPMNSVSK